jgi:CheY-like chemotaxis protein
MQTEQSNPAVNFTRAKIMIVDDDPELRMALKMRLRANQYETVSATDGYSAIALAQKERPNLIILDLGLPAGNGYSVLKRLQESDALSSIPVIVLTARDPLGQRVSQPGCGRHRLLPETRGQQRTARSDTREPAVGLALAAKAAVVGVCRAGALARLVRSAIPPIVRSCPSSTPMAYSPAQSHSSQA